MPHPGIDAKVGAAIFVLVADARASVSPVRVRLLPCFGVRLTSKPVGRMKGFADGGGEAFFPAAVRSA
jgi:hypothetical protein